jgi:ribosomal subunit interface protein
VNPHIIEENIMDLQITSRDVDMTEALHTHTHDRVLAALSQHDAHVDRVEVQLSDVNGPKGGVDKHCQVLVHMGRPPKQVMIKKSHSDLYLAVSQAADAAKTTIGREVSKLKDHHPH